MSKQARVFLIRHGETVDNVAGLWAGSRDSELTNHGYQQATRLGLHFQSIGLTFTHIFSSHLQRAAKTAELIRAAQTAKSAGAGDAGSVLDNVPDVVQVPVLMERDFGSMEGKKWHEKPSGLNLSGRDVYREEHKGTPGFVDVETKEALSRRADTFLEDHLLPLLDSSSSTSNRVVAIVSHGIMLSRLWKRLLLRLPPKSVSLTPALLADGHAISLEHLGGWSNTGYLELLLQMVTPTDSAAASVSIPSPAPTPSLSKDIAGQAKADADVQDATVVPGDTVVEGTGAHGHSPMLVHGWTTVIQIVNGRDHLKGLKRTRGGVGSARHDASQKSIDSFFKRRKLE